jgi:hypothetical protein
MNTEIVGQFFVRFSSIEFNRNRYIRSRVISHVWTEGRFDFNSRSLGLGTRLKGVKRSISQVTTFISNAIKSVQSVKMLLLWVSCKSGISRASLNRCFLSILQPLAFQKAGMTDNLPSPFMLDRNRGIYSDSLSTDIGLRPAWFRWYRKTIRFGRTGAKNIYSTSTTKHVDTGWMTARKCKCEILGFQCGKNDDFLGFGIL